MIMVIANGKGGVGKSSITANIAAAFAEEGRRVVIVDLDPQANQAEVLFGLDEHDEGLGLYQAAMTHDSSLIKPVTVRENIDLIPSGLYSGVMAEQITIAAHFLGAAQTPNGTVTNETRAAACFEVRDVLAEVAARYDVMLIDTPPASGNTLAIAGLITAEYMIIPTKAGKLARLGLSKLVQVYTDHGSPCVLLGVVLVDMPGSVKSLGRDEVKALEELFSGGHAPLLGSIRSAERATFDQEELGMTAPEYHAAAMQIGRKGGSRFASNTEGLTQDYLGVVRAINVAIASAEAATGEGV